MCITNKIPQVFAESSGLQGERAAAGGRLAGRKQPREQNASGRWEEMGGDGCGWGAGQSEEFRCVWGVGIEARSEGGAHRSPLSARSSTVPGCPVGQQKGPLLLPQLTLECFDLFPVSILGVLFVLDPNHCKKANGLGWPDSRCPLSLEFLRSVPCSPSPQFSNSVQLPSRFPHPKGLMGSSFCF